jgi:hypothetical protein
VPVVRAHAGQRGERDGRHGGGDGHLDGQIGVDLLAPQKIGQHGHEQHAAAYAQQAGEEPCDQTEGAQLEDQEE